MEVTTNPPSLVLVRIEELGFQRAIRTISEHPGCVVRGEAMAIRSGERLVLVIAQVSDPSPWPGRRSPSAVSGGRYPRVVWELRRAKQDPLRLTTRWNPSKDAVEADGFLEMLVCADGSLWAAFWLAGHPPIHAVVVKGSVTGTRLTDSSECDGLQEILPRTSGLFGAGSAIDAWRSLEVAIIGAGRTGSILADALSSQGVRKMTMVDGDRVEPGNLDGMALVSESSIGTPKVQAVGESLTARFPSLAFTGLASSFPTSEVISAIAGADVLVTATDSDEPRLFASSLSRRLLQIHADIGTGTDPGAQSSGADIRVCLPHDRCLVCFGGVASNQTSRQQRPGTSTRLINAIAAHATAEMLARVFARREMASRWIRIENRAADGRIAAFHEHAPLTTTPCPCCVG